eukprot:7173149-Pyramimonas_sp.AAC.1
MIDVDTVHHFAEIPVLSSVNKETQLVIFFGSEMYDTSWMYCFPSNAPFSIVKIDVQKYDTDSLAMDGLNHPLVMDILARRIFGVIGRLYGYADMWLWGHSDMHGVARKRQSRA